MRRMILVLLAAVVMLPAVPASADNPALPMSLTSAMTFQVFNPGGPGGSGYAEGTFETDSSVVCVEGEVLSEYFSVLDRQGYTKFMLATETYTCDDGSFQVLYVGRRTMMNLSLLTFQATVVIIGGTGAYTGLRGQGSGVAVANADTWVTSNQYEILLHAS